MMNEADIPVEGKVALLAEDDRDIRDLVRVKLTSAGFTVIAVGDGATALKMATEHEPDIALLDVMMPGMSGLDLMRELHADPRTQSIPVILLTAKSQEFDVETGFALGAADYIVKPFSPRELVQRVETVLARIGA
jgi:two-component system phosphate regulon response regulator PhoB